MLQPYPFERLSKLLNEVSVPEVHQIMLTVGEPQHRPPAEILEILKENTELVSKYPSIEGVPEFRESIAAWLMTRFGLVDVDPSRHVLPLNGTREGLFGFAQVVVTPGQANAVICPNPFYQIYEGAALLSGTQPLFINCGENTDFLPDLDSIADDQWQSCQLLYLCTPGNPSGAVMPLQQLQHIISLAHQHDFVIASDECYSEIYRDEQSPPPGLLQASKEMGHGDYSRCLSFHSLSKRSNLAGLRSGFIAGDAFWIQQFRRYRTYHGCAMPLHHQIASSWAWSDERHVKENRHLYREKFKAVLPVISEILDISEPDAGFYLWPKTPINDEIFTKGLISRTGVGVLPGSYLARKTQTGNPGANRIRIAMVDKVEKCITAANRIKSYVNEIA